jgi:hypothetical protein
LPKENRKRDKWKWKRISETETVELQKNTASNYKHVPPFLNSYLNQFLSIHLII